MKYIIKPIHFVKLLSFTILIFLAYHLSIWYFYTSKMLNLPTQHVVGDLGRMSYQINSLDYRKNYKDLNVSHFYKINYNGQKIDIVTLGDSFFNGGSGGKNAYIQDYLVQDTNLTVLNILNFNPQQSPITLIENMIETGWFNKYEPKYFILETVERDIPTIFNLTQKFPIKDLTQLEAEILSPGQDLFTFVPEVSMINTANYKISYYRLVYIYNNHAQKQVYKFKLIKDLFSVKNSNTLLCYNEDIKRIASFSNNKLNEVNDKINKLSQTLSNYGIKLIFLVSVDKYDLYSDYIENNPFPENTFFQRYNNLKKDYIFIDTKNILTKLLKDNTLDVFYADDTHWSYKANEAISKKLSKYITGK